MSELKILTVPQQVAQHLKSQIALGLWNGTMPGKHHLAAEYGISHHHVEAALQQLELEDVLESQGVSRPRRIASAAEGLAVPQLRVGILLWDAGDRKISTMVDIFHRLTEAGHSVIDPRKTLMDLKMDVKRVASLVKQTPADAWVVSAGSHEVLEWFLQQKLPVFAVSGGCRSLPIAASGAALDAALVKATRSLIELGHSRIVLLVRRQHRLPKPGISVAAFLATLKAYGIRTSSFNLPDWEETVEGFQECLNSLFKVSAPTAIFIDESQQFIAVRHFLATRGLRVPQDVSLICMDNDPVINWCVPTIANIRLESKNVVRHLMSWAKNISHCKKDVRQHIYQAEYVPGGTVGPAKE